MQSLIADLAVLLGVLGLTGLSLVGWGRFCAQLMRLNVLQTPLTMLVWLGFAVVLVLTEAIHLLLPIDWHVSAALGVVGIIGTPKARLLSSYRTLRTFVRQHPFVFMWAAGWIVLCCMRTTGMPNNFDSGLYHFQSIRWLNEEALAVGLGNLHWRLALNQSYFGFLALLNVFPLWGHGYAAGGLFLVLLTYATVLDFLRTERMVVRLFVGAVLLTVVSYYAGTLANPSPDTAIALIQIPICLWLIRLTQIDIKVESNTSRCLVTAILLLSVALVTIKLSSLVFAGTAVLVGAVVYFKDWKANKQQLYRLGLYVVIATAIYTFRGYLLSGYPLFPATLLGNSNLPWALPVGQLEYETKLIYSWARAPGVLDPDTVLKNWDWLSSWLSRLPAMVWSELLIGIAVSVVNCFYLKKGDHSERAAFLAYIPLIAGIVFWFITAPDPRFLGAIPDLFLSSSLFIFLRLVCSDTLLTRIERAYLVRAPKLFITTLLILYNLKLIGLGSLSRTGWMPIQESALQENRSRQGALIYTSTADSQCWNAKLPCAAAFDPKLHVVEVEIIPYLPIDGLSRKVFSIR